MKKIILLSIFCYSCILSAQDLNLRIKFHPGISSYESQNIDVQIDIIIDAQVIAQRHLNSYPPSLIQPVDNLNNDAIYIKVNVISPLGWAVNKNPVKYNPYNRKITVRRVNDVYFNLKHKAEENSTNGAYTSAIKNYDYILENKLFSSENQQFEITRKKANALYKKGFYEDALNTYLVIPDQINLNLLGKKRKQVYVKELFNAILKAGKYSKLKLPSRDFTKVIQSNKAFPINSWKKFTGIFNDVYPNLIELTPSNQQNIPNKVIKKQFQLIGKRLNTF